MKKYEAVINYIYKSIRTGTLYPGDYLPSIRMMAQALGISTVTVYDAYCRLEREGLVESSARRGFTLLDRIGEKKGHADKPSQIVDEDLKVWSEIHADHFENTLSIDPKVIRFGAMAPKNNYFPSDELSKSLVRVIRSYPYDININGLSEELEIVTVSFRKLTSDFMFRTCGIAVSDEEICTTYGASEALMYAISASTKPGGMVAVEDPGFMGVRSSIHFLKLNHIEIPTTPPHGLDIDRFELLLDYGLRPSCLVVTPNFQNPTGSLMPLENRQRLIALCKRYSIVLIEDDVLGALRYGPSVPVLKSLSPDDVIYVSSFSKILAPGYHTGWFCAGKYTKSLESMRPFVPSATSNLSQLAVAQYLSEGKAKNYLQRLRKTYERNRDIMAEAIRDGFPENTDVFVPQGGQYLWVQMPENVSANEMYFEARKKNILLAPGVLFSQQCHFQNCLRFCYALEMTPDIIDAIGYVGGLAKKRIQ